MPKTPCLQARVLVSLALAGLVLAGCAKESDTSGSGRSLGASPDAGVLHPGAPPETAQFGQLVGEWEARQVSRRGDGSWSEDTTTASWIWRYTLDGDAIQDDWIVPPVADRGSVGFHGMNIRIYDPEEQLWHIAWVDNKGRKVSVFTARGDSTRIVMTGVDARGRPSRNIFSEITPTSFLWTKEWTFDEGRSWVAVSQIRCVRKR